ncbi:hypothetical protein [Membranihabitans maritimus]|uniref:hypothetical protein n=1 Tax=Membranihabitans maritimus TaxID=2904244 RepID=UPI001F3255A2|nr:hypothetical protein [Membranihabitans maritimus]
MDINDYIQKNKSEFDDRDFDENLVWNRIEKELPPPRFRIIPLLKRAAIACIIIISAITLYQYGYYEGSNRMFNEGLSELNAIETYYGQKYEVLKSSLENNNTYEQTTKDAFLKTMEVLELENIKLKDRLNRNIDDEKVMMALVENYKEQIQALEDFLGKSQMDKNEKNDDREYLSL